MKKIDPNDPSKGDDDFPVWAIILIVIMSLVILGVLGFFIYKKKFAGRNDDYMNMSASKPKNTDVVSEGGYSL